MYAGNIFHFIKLEVVHVQFLYFSWASFYLLTVFVASKLSVRRSRWLDITRVLTGTASPSILGLTKFDNRKLIGQSKVVFAAAAKNCRAITWLLFATQFVIYSNGYEHWWQVVLIGTPHVISGCLFAFNLCGAIYILNSYIFTISLLLRIHLRRARSLIEFSWRFGSGNRFTCPIRNLRQMNQILVLIKELNEFWKYSITLFFMGRLIIINLSAYVLLFEKHASVMSIALLVMILSSEISAFTFLFFQAAIVSREAELLRKGLQNRFVTVFRHSRVNKLKVIELQIDRLFSPYSIFRSSTWLKHFPLQMDFDSRAIGWSRFGISSS